MAHRPTHDGPAEARNITETTDLTSSSDDENDDVFNSANNRPSELTSRPITQDPLLLKFQNLPQNEGTLPRGQETLPRDTLPRGQGTGTFAKGNTLTRLTRLASAKASVKVNSQTLSRFTQLVAGESFRTQRYSTRRGNTALKRRPAFRLSRLDLVDETKVIPEVKDIREIDGATGDATDAVVAAAGRKTEERDTSWYTDEHVKAAGRRSDDDEEEKAEYWCSCLPPRLFMAAVSATQIAMYIWYPSIHDRESPLEYDPSKRQEVWRFLTYSLIHLDVEHIIINMVIQLLLGLFLELFFWWQVCVIYTAGVLSGGLAHSVLQRSAYAVGASGGVSALVTAHFAKVIVNYSEMKRYNQKLRHMIQGRSGHNYNVSMYSEEEDKPPNRLDRLLPVLGGLMWFILALGLFVEQVIIAWIKHKDEVSYSAHLGGALCGLLLGAPLLILNRDTTWKKIFFVVSMSLFASLVLVCVIINIVV